jgi:hypothetical protein
MIQGNQTWTQALGQAAKRPLYTLEIPAFGIIITSWPLSADPPVQASPGGYGVNLYGLGAYGT